MEDRKADLLRLAREYGMANKNLYELLSVTESATQPEVQRAWRKTSLRYHPDKAEAYDPAMWELLEQARDVLSYPEARAIYNGHRATALQAQRARAAYDAERREMVEDLEARERGTKRKAGEGPNSRRFMTEAERKAFEEAGKIYTERRRKIKQEARARERELERAKAEAARGQEAQAKGAAHPRTQSGFGGINTTAASTSTSADNEAPESPVSSSSGPPSDYDERIAYLQREDRELERQAAIRHAAAMREADRNTGNTKEARQSSTRPPATASAAANTKATTLPPKSRTDPPPRQPSPPKQGRGDFSSTMERLRAAQREKERKKAGESSSAMDVDGAP
ncbi:hypothetical protein GGR50DRAFT_690354 [Xylaria sp. CBS 124048]|nr:hypothetical protein GGR50DRAFT_690354 [Xylaria sp. CBS 124048]